MYINRDTEFASAQSGEKVSYTVFFCFFDRKKGFLRDEDTTVGALCLRAGLDHLVDCVLVDASSDLLVSQGLSASSCAGLTLVAEPRLRFLLRSMPQLLEHVSEAERKTRRATEVGPLRYAWRVVLDAGTWEAPQSENTLVLVSESTRLDGVRHVPASLAGGGDLRGVAVHRRLALLGVARLAWLAVVLFSDCAPHLMQVGKLTSAAGDEAAQVVLLQQKPVFYRSLHDVLVEPRAASLRGRIDAEQLSALTVASMLLDMASCRPSSVLLCYAAERDSFGLELGAECLESALQPAATFCDERGEEMPAVCNILWMLDAEMQVGLFSSVFLFCFV